MLSNPQGTAIPLNNPNMPGAAAPAQSGNVGSVSDMLAQLLKTQAMQRQQVMLPQQVPPPNRQPGDVSGNFVNPSTIGGPKHNARVTMAQSIGQMISSVETQHDQKKARDIAYDMQRIETAMNNPSPENIDLVNTIMYKHGNPTEGLTPRGKQLKEALNINLFDDSKTKPEIKQARQIIFGKKQQQQQQQQPPAPQPQMQKSTIGPDGKVVAGNDAYGQFSKQFPTAMGLSPEAQVNAQAIALGISPHADKIMDYLKQQATDDNKWNMLMQALKVKEEDINQKDMASFRKSVIDGDKLDVMLHIAKIRSGATTGAAKIRASAEDNRSAALKQIADSRNVIKASTDSLKLQTDSLTKQITADANIIKSKDSSPSMKKAAAQEKAQLEATLEGIRNTSNELQKQYQNLGSMAASSMSEGTKDAGSDTTDYDIDRLIKSLDDNE